jgi:hypothetical protein
MKVAANTLNEAMKQRMVRPEGLLKRAVIKPRHPC